MAFILTYQTLSSTLQTYCERTDENFIKTIPTFIMLGQHRLARELKILNTKNLVTDTLTANQPIYQKPVDWLNTISFSINTQDSENPTTVFLEERTYEYCNIFAPDTSYTAQPLYFADYSYTTFYIAPTPDQNYGITLTYNALPPLLDETVGTNIITQTIPEILLYACLLETAPYLRNDERSATWMQYYQQAKSAITEEDVARINAGFLDKPH